MDSKRVRVKTLCVLRPEETKNEAVETQNYYMETTGPKHHNIKIFRPK